MLRALTVFFLLALLPACTGTGPEIQAAGSNSSSSSSSPARLAAPATSPSMEKLLSVHAWARSGASVLLARIEKVDVQPGDPGQQVTTLGLRIEEALFGPRGAEHRTARVVEPASATARLKFPAPVWGAVSLRRGTSLILVSGEAGAELREPMFAREVQGPDDPLVVSLRTLLAREASPEQPEARRARYVTWLSAGTTLERLFGAAALSRDEDLPGIDPEGDVAVTFARVLGAEKDALVRVALFDRAFPSIYDRTSEAGRVALIGALFAGAADPSEDVRRAALDALAELPEKDAELPGVKPSPGAASHIEERIVEETDASTKARLRKWLQKAQ